MWMASNKLFGDTASNIVEVELALVLRDARLKDDLEQHVTKLLADRCRGAGGDRVEHLVSLLQQIGAERLEGLLPIPGTTIGATQPVHDAAKTIHLGQDALPSVEAS